MVSQVREMVNKFNEQVSEEGKTEVVLAGDPDGTLFLINPDVSLNPPDTLGWHTEWTGGTCLDWQGTDAAGKRSLYMSCSDCEPASPVQYALRCKKGQGCPQCLQGQLVAGFKYAAHGENTKEVRLSPSPQLVFWAAKCTTWLLSEMLCPHL